MANKRLPPNKHYVYWSIEHWPKVPKEMGIGQPAILKIRGQTHQLHYDDGDPIKFGDDLIVADKFGHIEHWRVLYNAYLKRITLNWVEGHRMRDDGWIYHSYEYGIEVKPDMRLPKTFTESKELDWWKYIHNSI